MLVWGCLRQVLKARQPIPSRQVRLPVVATGRLWFRSARLWLYCWKPCKVERFVLYCGSAEVDQQRIWDLRGAKVVNHLSPFGLCQGLDGLEFNDVAPVKAREVGPVARLKPCAFVIDVDLVLPGVRDGVPLELQFQRVGIRRFEEAMPEGVVNPHGATHDGICFGIVG